MKGTMASFENFDIMDHAIGVEGRLGAGEELMGGMMVGENDVDAEGSGVWVVVMHGRCGRSSHDKVAL